MRSEALADAIGPDNLGRPETILVITDGAPENRQTVEYVIQNASEMMHSEDDIRIVFVQVGVDASATRWLGSLKQRLHTKFDIVETISSAQLSRTGVPFAEWVSQSIISNAYIQPLNEFHAAAQSPPNSKRKQLPALSQRVVRPEQFSESVESLDYPNSPSVNSPSVNTIGTPLGGHVAAMPSLISEVTS
jgi:hypothetical protein